MVFMDYKLLARYHCPTVNPFRIGMAESPSIAMIVSAILRCDLVSILFGDLT